MKSKSKGLQFWYLITALEEKAVVGEDFVSLIKPRVELALIIISFPTHSLTQSFTVNVFLQH